MNQPQSQPPVRVGQFTITRRVASNRFRELYLATSPDHPRVVITVLGSESAARRVDRERFTQTVAQTRSLRAAGLPTVVASGGLGAAGAGADGAAPDVGGRPWVVTVAGDGPTLAERVESDGPLPPERVLELVAGLAGALAVLHAGGLVHGDLDPSAVVLTDAGPELLAVGANPPAVVPDGRDASDGTAAATAYRAPEQLSGSGVGSPADVFSLGALAYFAASGRPPFHGETAADVATAVLAEEPELTPLPDARVRAVIWDALAKDPMGRPTAAEVARFVAPSVDAGAGAVSPAGVGGLTAMLAAGGAGMGLGTTSAAAAGRGSEPVPQSAVSDGAPVAAHRRSSGRRLLPVILATALVAELTWAFWPPDEGSSWSPWPDRGDSSVNAAPPTSTPPAAASPTTGAPGEGRPGSGATAGPILRDVNRPQAPRPGTVIDIVAIPGVPLPVITGPRADTPAPKPPSPPASRRANPPVQTPGAGTAPRLDQRAERPDDQSREPDPRPAPDATSARRPRATQQSTRSAEPAPAPRSATPAPEWGSNRPDRQASDRGPRRPSSPGSTTGEPRPRPSRPTPAPASRTHPTHPTTPTPRPSGAPSSTPAAPDRPGGKPTARPDRGNAKNDRPKQTPPRGRGHGRPGPQGNDSKPHGPKNAPRGTPKGDSNGDGRHDRGQREPGRPRPAPNWNGGQRDQQERRQERRDRDERRRDQDRQRPDRRSPGGSDNGRGRSDNGPKQDRGDRGDRGHSRPEGSGRKGDDGRS